MNVKTTPAKGLWRFDQPVTVDRLELFQFVDNLRLKTFTIEYTTDPNPSLESQFLPVSNLEVGINILEKSETYKHSLSLAASTFSAANWPFTRNTRTTAQTIIGLNAALPYLSGDDLNAASLRIGEAEQQLRSTQHDDGGWNDSGNGVSLALQSAEALEALLLVTKNSSDLAVIKGAEYLIATQKNNGSWNPPPGLAKSLASTTWVQIALPTIFENLSSITLGIDHRTPLGSKSEAVVNSFNPTLDAQTQSTGQLNARWSAFLNNDAGPENFKLVVASM